MQRIVTAAVAAGMAFCVTCGAQAAAFTNGSFELPGGAPIKQQLGDGSAFVTGWVNTGTGQYYESDGQDGINASDGDYWVAFGHNGTTGGTLSQTFSTVLNATYTVNYDFRLQQGSDANSRFQVSASTGDSVDTADASLSGWASGPALVFVGTGGAVTLTFTDITGAGLNSNLALDNVRLDVTGGAVPEPATWAMMLLGFAGLGAALRSRRRPALAA
jgi:hypothetical protein